MEEGKRSCYTCTNFLRHYTAAGFRLIKSNCGTCTVRRIDCRTDKKFSFESGCEKWEAVEEPAGIQEKILNKLCNIEKEILSILAILQARQK